MVRYLTITVADIVNAKINDMMERFNLTNKSELVEELIRLGIPEYEKIKAQNNGKH